MEGDHVRRASFGGWLISIHSLRVEGDASRTRARHTLTVFQSTSSVWRETWLNKTKLKRQKKTSFQSTPSVWRETAALVRLWFLHFYFNPLPPCGGRRSGSQTYKEYFDISIHSLRVEGDGDLGNAKEEEEIFQSTPSVWRETCYCAK